MRRPAPFGAKGEFFIGETNAKAWIAAERDAAAQPSVSLGGFRRRYGLGFGNDGHIESVLAIRRLHLVAFDEDMLAVRGNGVPQQVGIDQLFCCGCL